MTYRLPFPAIPDVPGNSELQDALQRNFDALSLQLPAARPNQFPQLVTPGVTKINFGSAELEWETLKSNSEALEVEHGLGTTPVSVVGNFGFNASFVAFAAVGAYTTSKFTVEGYTPTAPTEAKKSTFNWIAIG